MKKLLRAIAAFAVLGGAFYIYGEMEGYPWKRAQIKKDAVSYLEAKYGMEAKAAGSSFNFKFDTYAAKAYDVRDNEKRIVTVERGPYYDEERGRRGERLEDNYSEVYWGRQAEERLREKFPRIYGFEGVREIGVSTVYSTLPMEEGASAEKDEYGVRIPEKSGHLPTWDIDLASEEFPEAFLQELLSAIGQMRKHGPESDLFVSAEPAGGAEEELRGKTKYLHLEYEEFGRINGLEELRAAISEY